MSYNCRSPHQDVLLLTLSLLPPYEIIIRELGKYCDLIGISDCVCLSVCLSLYWLQCTNTRDLSTRQSILPHAPPSKVLDSSKGWNPRRSTNTHSIKRIACLGLIAIFTKVVMIIVNNLIKTSSSQRKAGLQRAKRSGLIHRFISYKLYYWTQWIAFLCVVCFYTIWPNAQEGLLWQILGLFWFMSFNFLVGSR